ncbi:MAG: ATPase [Bacteroidetes bacterium 4572_77]|nr:MAG: ATPase [Bacteroidetes bacterium 4572_77]
MSIIQIKDICKSYGEAKALSHISVEINKNELFGFIGPDGAGKTTLFRILASLLLADSGSANMSGLDVVKDYKVLRTQLGYMPGRFSLYQDLTVEENLNFFAGIFKTTVKENYHLIADIYQQIEPFKKRKAGDLSGGMKQKLALSCALIHKPEIILLDEPTTGVDAVSRMEFWEMLNKLKQQGITILVSTPYMDEASLCDRVALMQKGQLMGIDEPQKIVDLYSRKLVAVKASNMYKLVNELRLHPKCYSAYLFGEWIHYASDLSIDTTELQAFLQAKGINDAQITAMKPSMEDSFMDLMTRNQ